MSGAERFQTNDFDTCAALGSTVGSWADTSRSVWTAPPTKDIAPDPQTQSTNEAMVFDAREHSRSMSAGDELNTAREKAHTAVISSGKFEIEFSAGDHSNIMKGFDRLILKHDKQLQALEWSSRDQELMDSINSGLGRDIYKGAGEGLFR
jgi:hypothetical protein